MTEQSGENVVRWSCARCGTVNGGRRCAYCGRQPPALPWALQLRLAEGVATLLSRLFHAPLSAKNETSDG